MRGQAGTLRAEVSVRTLDTIAEALRAELPQHRIETTPDVVEVYNADGQRIAQAFTSCWQFCMNPQTGRQPLTFWLGKPLHVAEQWVYSNVDYSEEGGAARLVRDLAAYIRKREAPGRATLGRFNGEIEAS